MQAKRRYTVPAGEKLYIQVYLSAIWKPHIAHFMKTVDIEELDEEEQAFKKLCRMVDVKTYIQTTKQADGARTRLMVVFRKYEPQKKV